MRKPLLVSASVGVAALLVACATSHGTASDEGIDAGDASFHDAHGQTLGDAQLTKDVTAKDASATDAHQAKDVAVHDAGPPPDAADAACSPLETPCTDPGECCGGAQCGQVGGLVVKWCCSDTNGACTQDSDCCGDLRCASGGVCVATCLPLETPCNAPSDCCVGATCAQVGGLIQDWCCSPQDGGCLVDNDCCGNLRCSGAFCN